MGQNTGIAGLANAINAGLTGYRDTRRDVEDRAMQKEERDLRNQQIRLQTAGLQRQEDKAKTYDANQQSYQGLRQGMGLAGYDDTLKSKVLENQANIMGDAESADKFSSARKALEKEGAIDALRYVQAGDFQGAVNAYNSTGKDRISALERDPQDPTGKTLIFTDPMGKKGTINVGRIESMLADPMDAAKRVADNADMVAKTNEEIRKWSETEGTRNPKQFVGSGGLFFDTVAGQYVPMPEWAQGLRFKSGKGSSTAGGGLSDAELMANEQIMNARRRLVADRVLANDPRLDKLSTKYDPAIEEAVKIANGTLYGGDPQASKFAAGERAPVWKQGKAAGLQKPQAVQGKSAPPGAIDLLSKNPSLAPQFKAKYGYLPEGFNGK